MQDGSTGLKKLWNEDRDAKRVATVMAVALGAGCAVVWFALPTTATQLAGLLWAAAWSSIGWFLGFLFGIPRFLSTDTARTPAAAEVDNAKMTFEAASAAAATSRAAADAAARLKAEADSQAAGDAGAAQAAADAAAAAQTAEQKATSDEAALEAARSAVTQASARPAAAARASISVNTNLEQISDWLTKIIVGVALVEFRTLIEQMKKAAAFVAMALGGEAATSLSFAIILYFLVSGLLGSYLLTRLFLQGALANAARQDGVQ